jgi:hypothetical protein
MTDEQPKPITNQPQILQEPGTVIKLSTLIKLHATMTKVKHWLDIDARHSHPDAKIRILKKDVDELMEAVQRDINDYRKLVEQGL